MSNMETRFSFLPKNIRTKVEKWFFNDVPKDVRKTVLQKIRGFFNKKDNKGFIYVFKCNEFYKIGISGNVENRFQVIDKSIPFEMSVDYKSPEFIYINKGKIEKHLHKEFKAKRIKGEWFKLNKSDLNKIKNIIADDYLMEQWKDAFYTEQNKIINKKLIERFNT